MDVYIDDKRTILDPASSIGKGGEGEVFKINPNEVVKVYKGKDHIDYRDDPDESIAAETRIKTHQTKLPALLKLAIKLPTNDVVPLRLAYTNNHTIIGYVMRLLPKVVPLQRFTERSFHNAGMSNNIVTQVFRNLHATVNVNHNVGVVMGDFNSLNVLVEDTNPFIIDVDSFQFGNYYCYTYTDKYVDPLCCALKGKSPELIKPHNQLSDWFAFQVLLFHCLLCLTPYAGVYLPKDKAKTCAYERRSLRRITVFDPEVLYPKDTIAFHYKVLPDDLLHYFYETFAKDVREVFPLKFLDNIRWTKCSVCHTEHARDKCPICDKVSPTVVIKTVIVRGKVKATSIFKTSGLIVFAAMQRDKLQYLYHEDDTFYREGRASVIAGKLDPQNKYRICGSRTYIAKQNRVIELIPSMNPFVINVSDYKGTPIFDSNSDDLFYVSDGRLLRDQEVAPKHVGTVLNNQTLFWVGANFGFGFYSAGDIRIAFVFDAKDPVIKDSVKLPVFRGEIIDTTALFTSHLCWFFITMQEKGKTINRCFVINSLGDVIAKAEAISGDNSWLSTIRGKCATAYFLFAITYTGIVRLEIQNKAIIQVAEFPDTEPFVSDGSYMFPGGEGLYVVDPHEIKLLEIS